MSLDKRIVVCLALVAGAVIILFSYRSRGGNFLPYFLILLCPLMHLFMMGGHGGKQAEDKKQTKTRPAAKN